MNNELVNKFCDSATGFFKKHGAIALAIVGSAGVIGTGIMAAKETPKALRLIDEAKKEKGEELTTWEKVKIMTPAYIPAMVVGVSTIVCIFGSNALTKKQQASLASAYALLNQGYKEYRGKLKELYGEEADINVRDAIMKDKIEKVEPEHCCYCETRSLDEYCDNEDICLFYDEFSGRYFESTLVQVQAAEYHLNRNFALRGDVSLNEYFSFLGLSEQDYGDALGWTCSDEIYWLDFDHRKVNIDDLEVILMRPYKCAYAISYMYEPREGYLE